MICANGLSAGTRAPDAAGLPPVGEFIPLWWFRTEPLQARRLASEPFCVPKNDEGIVILSRVFRRLLQDENGFLSATDYILATTILAFGAIVGLVTLRDAVVQEFGDIAVALEFLPQTYSVTITLSNGSTKSFGYTDSNTLTDPVGQAPAGINLSLPPNQE